MHQQIRICYKLYVQIMKKREKQNNENLAVIMLTSLQAFFKLTKMHENMLWVY